MADNTAIEWTDATWNPVTGCAVVSPGCTNCYAMRLAGTRLAHHPSRAGLTRDSKAGPVWTGETRLNEEWLTQPLRWRRPRRIFVCAHGDLFAESVPDEWIDKVFAVMALAPQHTFQVLTKRAKRMREYLTDKDVARRIWILTGIIADHGKLAALAANGAVWGGDEPWPLRNVWLGVSVEDQTRAEERIPHLLATPAAVRFVSAEPLLGPVDFLKHADWARMQPLGASYDKYDPLTGNCEYDLDETGSSTSYLWGPKIDWIIVGGESGPGARPMRVEWAQNIVAQCRAAGVACFVKQLSSGGPHPIKDMALFPDDLRVREMPNARKEKEAAE